MDGVAVPASRSTASHSTSAWSGFLSSLTSVCFPLSASATAPRRHPIVHRRRRRRSSSHHRSRRPSHHRSRRPSRRPAAAPAARATSNRGAEGAEQGGADIAYKFPGLNYVTVRDVTTRALNNLDPLKESLNKNQLEELSKWNKELALWRLENPAVIRKAQENSQSTGKKCSDKMRRLKTLSHPELRHR